MKVKSRGEEVLWFRFQFDMKCRVWYNEVNVIKENLERMGMTVKQIAEKIGVSKPAIRQKIKRNPELETRLRELSETVGQTVYYNDEAVALIMALFPIVSETPETIAENVSGNVCGASEGVSEGVSGNVCGAAQPSPAPSEATERALLQQTIEALTAQLSAKDAQLAKKDIQLADLTSALFEAQQIQQQLSSALATSQETQKQLTDALAAALALHAGTIQMQQQVQQQQPETPVVDASSDLDPEEKGDAKVQLYPKNRKHRGFFANLFGKN